VRLLVVEDDERLSGLLRRGLRAEGYAVDCVASVEDALWMATENAYDGAVVDIGLPDGDGFSLCARLRAARCWTPLLMLTARGAIADRVRGLDVGADDYVVKPFAFTELSARIRALVRRGGHERPPIARMGGLTLDRARRLVTVHGRPLPLSMREFALLELFLHHPDEVLSRAEIIEHVWDWAYDGGSNVVDVYVHALRVWLGTDADLPRIDTIRGAGYVLRSGTGESTVSMPGTAPP
jgi:two-component system OmpR family response regulator